MADQFIGAVVHQWRQVGAALISVANGQLSVGDTIRIKGHTTDFVQKLESMQVDHKPVDSARAGEEVAIGVTDRVRVQDRVFLVSGSGSTGPSGFLKRLFGGRP